MDLEAVVKNQLELTRQIAFRQNFELELGISQRNKYPDPAAIKSSIGDEYSTPAAIETKIAATQTNPPAPTKNSDILTAPLNQSTFERRDINVDEGAVKMSGFIVTVSSHQPELKHLEPNNSGRDEHEAVLPTVKIAAIEPSQTAPNPSQHQADERLQTELSFHPRSLARREEQTRFERNQSDFPKNLDGSLSLPWDTNKRGVFDQAFENHMARSLMQYPAYRDLMAGELSTKIRKHISAGRYDLKRRDELLIEWSAMHDHTRNDFSTGSSNLTAKGAARQAKILRALNMKD